MKPNNPSKERVLDVSNVKLNKKTLLNILKTISTDKTISGVDFSNNPGLGDEGVKMIAAYIMDSKHIKAVSLKNTGFGYDGACSLAALLHLNNHIKALDISHNNIDTNGGVLLLDALSQNIMLTSLKGTSKNNSLIVK